MTIEYLSEDFDPSEKTEMELEIDYRFYKAQHKWENHIIELAEKEVIYNG
jgi:hypothetical protein